MSLAGQGHILRLRSRLTAFLGHTRNVCITRDLERYYFCKFNKLEEIKYFSIIQRITE